MTTPEELKTQTMSILNAIMKKIESGGLLCDGWEMNNTLVDKPLQEGEDPDEVAAAIFARDRVVVGQSFLLAFKVPQEAVET